MALSGGWSPTARWRSPRIKARYLEQHQPSLEVGEGIKQWGLFAGDTGTTDRSPIIAFEVVIYSIDLEQT